MPAAGTYVDIDNEKIALLDKWLSFFSLRQLGKISGVGINKISGAMVRKERDGVASMREEDWLRIEGCIRQHGVIE